MPKWPRSRKLRWLCGIILAYALVMTFGGCADKHLLFPSTAPTDAHGAQRRTIPYDGGTLEIWTARSPGATRSEPEAFVLEFCGNATRAEHITAYVAQRWGDRPVEAWVANYPGYGGSTGPAKLASIGPASLVAYDELQRHASGRPIFLAGNSLGSCAALHVAANRPCAGMVLQNPPPLREVILGQYGWWNIWLAAGPISMQIPDDLNSLANAQRVKAPAAFILAEDDEIVAPEYQMKVVNAYAGEKRLIHLAGADHNAPVDGDAEKELDAALDWLWAGAKLSDTRRVTD